MSHTAFALCVTVCDIKAEGIILGRRGGTGGGCDKSEQVVMIHVYETHYIVHQLKKTSNAFKVRFLEGNFKGETISENEGLNLVHTPLILALRGRVR